jgi:Ni/Fe-hydrogenase subunit HybB-like protein
MHQSSLGALLLVAGTKVHPLWHTGLLPLLFLLTAFSLGYAVLYFESIFSSMAFRRPLETGMLASLGGVVGTAILAFLALRVGGLLAAGRGGLFLTSGLRSFAFWAELLLLATAATLFLRPSTHARPSSQLQAALLALAGGALYRIDTFLVAFQPGPGWSYFPSLGEIFVTLGLVATETVVYVVMVRRFPILAGVVLTSPPAAPVGIRQGAVS